MMDDEAFGTLLYRSMVALGQGNEVEADALVDGAARLLLQKNEIDQVVSDERIAQMVNHGTLLKVQLRVLAVPLRRLLIWRKHQVTKVLTALFQQSLAHPNENLPQTRPVVSYSRT